jgi:hypothetical protein
LFPALSGGSLHQRCDGAGRWRRELRRVIQVQSMWRNPLTTWRLEM